jgi:hypothetical protein
MNGFEPNSGTHQHLLGQVATCRFSTKGLSLFFPEDGMGFAYVLVGRRAPAGLAVPTMLLHVPGCHLNQLS